MADWKKLAESATSNAGLSEASSTPPARIAPYHDRSDSQHCAQCDCKGCQAGDDGQRTEADRDCHLDRFIDSLAHAYRLGCTAVWGA